MGHGNPCNDTIQRDRKKLRQLGILHSLTLTVVCLSHYLCFSLLMLEGCWKPFISLVPSWLSPQVPLGLVPGLLGTPPLLLCPQSVYALPDIYLEHHQPGPIITTAHNTHHTSLSELGLKYLSSVFICLYSVASYILESGLRGIMCYVLYILIVILYTNTI